jgi:hypothetical protein
MARVKKMPKKGRKKTDHIYRGARLRTDEVLWRKRGEGKDGKCPEYYHSAPAYHALRNSDTWCLKDCAKWKPARYYVGKRGACGPEKQRMRSMAEWTRGLRAHYAHAKKRNPDYSYAMAQHDYSKIYKRTHKRTHKKK